MYVYIESEHNLWTVGFYDPKGNWHPESDHDTKESAGNRVHFLNGDSSEEIPAGSWEEYKNFKKLHGGK